MFLERNSNFYVAVENIHIHHEKKMISLLSQIFGLICDLSSYSVRYLSFRILTKQQVQGLVMTVPLISHKTTLKKVLRLVSIKQSSKDNNYLRINYGVTLCHMLGHAPSICK